MITFTPILPKGALIDRAQLTQALTAAVRDTQAEGVRLMATYPPQASNSRYKRTGTLKRSWSAPPVVASGDTITGEIGSNGGMAPYNEQVEGQAQDAAFAARGWPAVPALVALVEKQLPLRAQAEINRVAAQGGR